MARKFNTHFSVENLEKSFNDKVSHTSSKGLDKTSVEIFKKNKEELLILLSKKLAMGSFKFTPYLESLHIKNRNTLPRMISIPTIRDRIVLDVMKNIMHSEFEHCLNRDLPNSHIKKIKKYIYNNKDRNIYFLKTDINKFYDEIQRDILITELEKIITDALLINLIKNAIKCPTVPSNYKKKDLDNYSKRIGIPQGLAISNILAQIYLNNFDVYFKSKLSKSLYLRYVDDIIILSCSSCAPLFQSVKNRLDKIKLQINKDKTVHGNINKSFDFLSYRISHAGISVSQKNFEKYIQSIASKFTWFKNGIKYPNSRPEWLINDDDRYKEVFIAELNEKITGSISKEKNYGWLFYYSEIDDITILYRIDSIINSFF